MTIRTLTEFKCLHCHQVVPVDAPRSKVRNRNHCPYCLWSRHLDLYRAGDRLSACKAQMKPVGLTCKQTAKKYAQNSKGELMLIHQCVECGKLSINRIAADDLAENLVSVYLASLGLDLSEAKAFQESGIQALEKNQRSFVQVLLFGKMDDGTIV